MWTYNAKQNRQPASSPGDPAVTHAAGPVVRRDGEAVLDTIVSESSRMIAAQRAIEAQAPFPLAYDPLAALFAGEQAIEKAKNRMLEKGAAINSPRIAIRTRYFDDKALQWTDPGNAQELYSLGTEEMKNWSGELFSCNQVVILGSGMDSRAWRLPWAESVSIFELDNKDVIQYKKAAVAKLGGKEGEISHRCKSHKFIIADVSNATNVCKSLQRAGFQPEESTLFIAEGLLYYLQADDIVLLLKRLSQFCQAPTVFLASILSTDAVLSAKKSPNPSQLSQEWKFGLDYDEVDSFFSSSGWKILTKHKIGEPLANYGRWTKPQSDRLYYITAIVQTAWPL